MKRVRIQAKVTWTVWQPPGSSTFLASCDVLGLSLGADSQSELVHCIAEAMDLLFEGLVADGLLEEFLRRHGWEAEDGGLQGVQDPSDVNVELPWELLYRDSSRTPATAH